MSEYHNIEYKAKFYYLDHYLTDDEYKVIGVGFLDNLPFYYTSDRQIIIHQDADDWMIEDAFALVHSTPMYKVFKTNIPHTIEW